MKGLAITTIIVISIFMLGMLCNLVEGSSNGYTVMAIGMMAPVLVFAIMFLAKYH